jgi:hypothetical protein
VKQFVEVEALRTDRYGHVREKKRREKEREREYNRREEK